MEENSVEKFLADALEDQKIPLVVQRFVVLGFLLWHVRLIKSEEDFKQEIHSIRSLLPNAYFEDSIKRSKEKVRDDLGQALLTYSQLLSRKISYRYINEKPPVPSERQVAEAIDLGMKLKVQFSKCQDKVRINNN